jgi:hypothetical protein
MWGYDRRRDMMTGHDFPGVCGSGMHGFALDELELGARAALAIDDPDGDQWWWALVGDRLLEQGGEREDPL